MWFNKVENPTTLIVGQKVGGPTGACTHYPIGTQEKPVPRHYIMKVPNLIVVVHNRVQKTLSTKKPPCLMSLNIKFFISDKMRFFFKLNQFSQLKTYYVLHINVIIH